MKKGSKRTLRSEEAKVAACRLRYEGFTHREIERKLGIPVSTIFEWTGKTTLSEKQRCEVHARNSERTFPKARREKLKQHAMKILSKHWRVPYSKEELLTKITDFYKIHNRIPLTREFNMSREYQERFGSWNKAIQAAGFKPHELIFSKRFTAKDGHICDSFAETIIDDWLFYNKLLHAKNFPYKISRLTADFKVGNFLIEYFGMAGQNKKYDDYILVKRDRAIELGLQLIEIYPKQLFKGDSWKYLNVILGILTKTCLNTQPRTFSSVG